MATANYVLLERIELTTSTTSITFDNIPQSGYTDLKVVVSARDNAEDWLELQFNGVTTGNTNKFIRGNGTSAASNSNAWLVAGIGNSATTANTFSNCEFYIPNYSVSGVVKSVSSDWATENNGTANYMGLSASATTNTSAITSIKILNRNTAVMQQYSSFSLYGLAAVGTTPVIAPKASGGDIILNDGTYWYHTFLASGAFVPNQSINCSYLAVAGGGGGSGNRAGGGGGGGLVIGTTTLSTGTAIAVGAKGAGSYDTQGGNTSGNPSQVGSLTAAVGGGTSDTNGGSGGGKTVSGTQGLGTSGQGNNGGLSAGTGSGGSGAGGGGGGYSAAGADASGTTVAGTGGQGWTITSDWTGSGAFSGMTVLSSGGGGGAPFGSSAAGGTGAGAGGFGNGSGDAANQSGKNATAYGCGGGGGAYAGGPSSPVLGGNGYQGIVIIKYPIA